jgi:hypothetical protein
MVFGWIWDKLRDNALKKGRVEVDEFVSGLQAMPDWDVGVILAVATAVRINMETHNVLWNKIFEGAEPPQGMTPGKCQLEINKIINQFNRLKQPADAAGAAIWSYSLRCLAVPEFTDLGRSMWAELKRGYPHVDAVLDEGEKQRGEPCPERVRAEWGLIPLGLEPKGYPQGLEPKG